MRGALVRVRRRAGGPVRGHARVPRAARTGTKASPYLAAHPSPLRP